MPFLQQYQREHAPLLRRCCRHSLVRIALLCGAVALLAFYGAVWLRVHAGDAEKQPAALSPAGAARSPIPRKTSVPGGNGGEVARGVREAEEGTNGNPWGKPYSPPAARAPEEVLNPTRISRRYGWPDVVKAARAEAQAPAPMLPDPQPAIPLPAPPAPPRPPPGASQYWMVMGIPTVPRKVRGYLTNTVLLILAQLPTEPDHPLFGKVRRRALCGLQCLRVLLIL